MERRTLRIIVGMLLCVGLGLAPWWLLQHRAASETTGDYRPAAALWNYWTGHEQTLVLQFPEPTDVAVGDPIFVREGTTSLDKVGHIEALLDAGGTMPAERAHTREARAVLYPMAPPLDDHYRIVYRTTPESFTWVVNTLLPEHRREAVAAEVQRAFEEYEAEIGAALKPVVEHTIVELWKIIQEDGITALQRERPTIELLAARYQQQIIDEQLAPLARDEIWPIVRERAEPVAVEVGRELWRRLSLWRFGWRAVYDVMPLLPDKKLVESEWSRFVQDEALPVLEDNTEEFIAVIVGVLDELASNKKVREALRESVMILEKDEELRALARRLLDEVVVYNPRVRTALIERLSSDEARDALAIADARFEPVARKIGDLLFGTQQEGLTPEFAHVVRTQILHKDHRWFLLEETHKPSTADDAYRLPNTLKVQVGGGGGKE